MSGVVEFAGLVIIFAAVVQAVTGVTTFIFRASAQRRQGVAELNSLKERAKILLERATSDRDRLTHSWNGKRKFRITKREYENKARDVCSFYLIPHDELPMPPFRAGQFLTFELPIPGQPQSVVRCYSLSDRAHDDYYRISIKKQGPPPKAPEGTPPGLSSSYFHDQLETGDIVEVMAPAGEFFLDEESDLPVVLIGGGVGLTPVVSMLETLVHHGGQREIWFFYGVRDRTEHAMYDRLKQIDEENANVHMVICYSQPTDTCRLESDYTHQGFVSVELIRSLLQTSNYVFYICGPPPMMEMITRELEAWGVPEDNIRFEAFGPATVKSTPEAGASDDEAGADGADAISVLFARSNKPLQWTPADGTLLEFGEANGIKLMSGCRAGNCGSCMTALKEGEAKHIRRPGKKPEDRSCLLCIAHPKGPIVLDA